MENTELLEWLEKQAREDIEEQKRYELMLEELNSSFILGVPPRRDKYGRIK